MGLRAMAAIDSTHPHYDKNREDWQRIADICDGRKYREHIIEINPADKSAENEQRNKTFRDRAVFVPFAGHTARGMVGMVFAKWPTCEVPPQLEYVKDNIDGTGNSIYQQSQTTTGNLVRTGRAGLWVDFPMLEGGEVSQADIDAGRVAAVCHRFDPLAIRDWDTRTEGAAVRLSYVVLADVSYERTDEGRVRYDVRIELSLDDAGIYRVQRWRKGPDDEDYYRHGDELTPLDASGRPWTEIPFMFVGSESNTPTVDSPPLLGIVGLNIGHLNNSAIYEDSVSICGQPQPWVSGLTADQARQLRSTGFAWGAGELLPVPTGERAGMEQAAPNTLAREAMRDKIELAVGLGANFIQPGSAVKTATQSGGEQRVQHSILSLIASNISEAYTQALVWMHRFMIGDVTGELEYTVSQDFVDPKADPNELREIIAGFMAGALPVGDYVRYMKRHNLFDEEKPDADYAEELGGMGDGSGGLTGE